MRRATPAFRDLARQLLGDEAEGQDPRHLIERAERVCQKLYRVLARLIGPEGYEVLLARARRLAAAEYPFLKAVEPEVSTGVAPESVRLRGLPASALGEDSGSTREALVALLGNFIWLLAVFLGEDLALRKVRQTWPEVSFGGADSGPEEASK